MTDAQFYFDFGSPNAFLSHRIIPDIEARTGGKFHYVPVLLGGLFKLTGNQSPMTAFAGIKNKPEYEAREMRRFITRHGIDDYMMNPFFPINTLYIMRGAVAAQELGVFETYVDRVYDEMWARGTNMGDMASVVSALEDADLPAAKILELAQTDAVKQRLMDNTQKAFENGAFGSPSFLVGTELYFGKDKLHEVEAQMKAG